MRISDWSSDVCSSDLPACRRGRGRHDGSGRPPRAREEIIGGRARTGPPDRRRPADRDAVRPALDDPPVRPAARRGDRTGNRVRGGGAPDRSAGGRRTVHGRRRTPRPYAGDVSMRAVLCRDTGGIDTLKVEDIEPPTMIEGGARIAVHAAGVSFANLLVITRSEEHTSELQSLMRNSYAAFCLKKKTQK